MQQKTAFYLMYVGVFLIAAVVPARAENTSPSGDPFIGEYTGVYHLPGYADLKSTGIVVSEGPGLYRTSVRCESPGGQTYEADVHGHREDTRLDFMGYSGSVLWKGDAHDDQLKVTRTEINYGGQFDLKKIIRHSPTEALAPPAGSVVLLPFKEGQAPNTSEWTNKDWQALADGSMEVGRGKGSNTTKKKFGDMRLHLEFCEPHLPNELGQARGNSGCYIQNRFEVQVLDSFGVISCAGDCAAIYEQAAPRVNACLPPGQWQTYDILFRAARMDKKGKVTENPRVTVVQNGVVVQDNVELPKESPGGNNKPAAKDVIQLQDHGNSVRYRNIWLVETDTTAVSAKDLIPK